MSDDEEPLDVDMSGKGGGPEAVAKVLSATANHLNKMPEDMQLSFELSIWEDGDD